MADFDRICATPRGIAGGWMALLVMLVVAGAVSAARPAPISIAGTAATSAALSTGPGPLALAGQPQGKR